ncbi:hypothetical protein Q4Q39_15410 [Flavivirga amylovorans]|uniref:Fibronectin type-III domain-containing protein n=1 Tax=Flavivirga amylovorans TaxID=870486 RepID=A0ABT8X4M7_9FLAO|nr:hypothetical protein [Flavivirga amylovorans]MDO5988797.1 hypothetical protein [Flavivirga amylovorans]
MFQFYTEGFGVENHLPFPASILSPKLNESVSGSSVLLSWGATDVDDDTLTFDVYLGTNNPPVTKLVSDHLDKSFQATSLTGGTDYYWKVVTKDSLGATATGQIWNFNTQ